MTLLHATVHSSPVGEILLASRDDALVRVHPTAGEADSLRAELERLGGVEWLSDADLHDGRDGCLSAAVSQLDAYFTGGLRTFDLPLDLTGLGTFARATIQAICSIPFGETAGYGEVAVLAGYPRAARAVGSVCANTPFSVVVPVHRVVRADGSLGSYGGHPELKRFLVEHEAEIASR